MTQKKGLAMAEQITLAWTWAGAAVYSVPGGFFVAYGGRVLAVALPDKYSSTKSHFKQPLGAVGVVVLDYPETMEAAVKLLRLTSTD